MIRPKTLLNYFPDQDLSFIGGRRNPATKDCRRRPVSICGFVVSDGCASGRLCGCASMTRRTRSLIRMGKWWRGKRVSIGASPAGGERVWHFPIRRSRRRGSIRTRIRDLIQNRGFSLRNLGRITFSPQSREGRQGTRRWVKFEGAW
jgi:hypothetical protein